MNSNKIHNKLLFLGCIFLWFIGVAHAQSNPSDFNSWWGAALEFEPHKKWQFSLEGQLRMKTNSTEIDQYFAELGTTYKLPLGFRLGAGARFIRDHDTQGAIQGYENHFRYHVDLQFRHDIDRLDLQYRVRYQNRNELGIAKSEGDIDREAIRLRLKLIYDFKNWKLDPELSGELFNRFRDGGNNNGFNQYRLALGTDYKVKKLGTFIIAYLFESEFNITNPSQFHILKLGYSFQLKTK